MEQRFGHPPPLGSIILLLLSETPNGIAFRATIICSVGYSARRAPSLSIVLSLEDTAVFGQKNSHSKKWLRNACVRPTRTPKHKAVGAGKSPPCNGSVMKMPPEPVPHSPRTADPSRDRHFCEELAEPMESSFESATLKRPSARGEVPLSLAMKRGLLGRCPNCGRTALFGSYLEQIPFCPLCGAGFPTHPRR